MAFNKRSLERSLELIDNEKNKKERLSQHHCFLGELPWLQPDTQSDSGSYMVWLRCTVHHVPSPSSLFVPSYDWLDSFLWLCEWSARRLNLKQRSKAKKKKRIIVHAQAPFIVPRQLQLQPSSNSSWQSCCSCVVADRSWRHHELEPRRRSPT